MNNRSNKIIRYRQPLRFNIGLVLFAVVLAYLIFCFVMQGVRGKKEYFVVDDKAALASVDTFRALVLRSEVLTRAGEDGIVNYYLRDGSRTAVGDIVCSIDRTGDYTAFLRSGLSSQSNEIGADFDQIKSALVSYNLNADKNNFSDAYDLKYSLESRIVSQLAVASEDTLSSLGISPESFKTVRAGAAGLVGFTIDGLEDLKAEDVTADIFTENSAFFGASVTANASSDSVGANASSEAGLSDSRGAAPRVTAAQSATLAGGMQVYAGSPLFKTIISDSWNLIVPLTSEQAVRYADKTTLRAEFPEKGLSTFVRSEIYTGADGKVFAKFTLSRFLPYFTDCRFTKLLITEDKPQGLILPKETVGQMECTVIPRSFAAEKKYTTSPTFMRITDRTTPGSVVNPRVISVTEDCYYVDPSSFNDGDMLAAYESDEIYVVGEKTNVSGVWCVNRGYPQFKAVEILDSDDNYIVVRDGTALGISKNDRILARAS